MSRRSITVRIDRAGFTHEEHFLSKVDAEHSRQMMEETLDMPQAAALDLNLYAAGLADTVRTCGGPYTRDCWLSGAAGPERWARGLVVPAPREFDEQVMAMLRGKRRG